MTRLRLTHYARHCEWVWPGAGSRGYPGSRGWGRRRGVVWKNTNFATFLAGPTYWAVYGLSFEGLGSQGFTGFWECNQTFFSAPLFFHLHLPGWPKFDGWMLIPSDPHTAQGVECLLQTLASRRAAGTAAKTHKTAIHLSCGLLGIM